MKKLNGNESLTLFDQLLLAKIQFHLLLNLIQSQDYQMFLMPGLVDTMIQTVIITK